MAVMAKLLLVTRLDRLDKVVRQLPLEHKPDKPTNTINQLLLATVQVDAIKLKVQWPLVNMQVNAIKVTTQWPLDHVQVITAKAMLLWPLAVPPVNAIKAQVLPQLDTWQVIAAKDITLPQLVVKQDTIVKNSMPLLLVQNLANTAKPNIAWPLDIVQVTAAKAVAQAGAVVVLWQLVPMLANAAKNIMLLLLAVMLVIVSKDLVLWQ